MKKQLFPKEFIGVSIENYHFTIRSTSRAIYLTLLASLVAGIAALPFVYVDVTKKVSGRITSATSRQHIYAPRSGQVAYAGLTENLILSQGDTILRYDATTISKEIDQLQRRKQDLEDFLRDLSVLGKTPIVPDRLTTPRYQLEYESFSSQRARLEMLQANAAKAYHRQQQLFENQVIAEKEFEADQLHFDQSRAELLLFLKQTKTDWKQQSLTLQKEYDQASTRLNQLTEELETFTVLAPANGSYQNVVPITPGQFIQSGMKLAELSPGDSLVALCYVSPVDIGLLRKGQKGTFRIDAFNYNEWGMTAGEILEISNDAYVMENGQPVFQVRCQLEKDYLELRSGFRGYLKKGMTFNANFRVASRSIYQLLYDKMDDWMNPLQNRQPAMGNRQ